MRDLEAHSLTHYGSRLHCKKGVILHEECARPRASVLRALFVVQCGLICVGLPVSVCETCPHLGVLTPRYPLFGVADFTRSAHAHVRAVLPALIVVQ